MKTLIATIMIGIFGLSGMVVSDSAEASYGSSWDNGYGTTYHNFSDGSGTSWDNGYGTTYHNFSDGSYGSSWDNGYGTTYHNWNH